MLTWKTFSPKLTVEFKLLGAFKYWTLRFSLVAVLALIWQMLAWSGVLNAFIMSSPLSIGQALIELGQSGQIFVDMGWSLMRVTTGFFISVSIGTPLGMALGLSRRFRFYAEPLVNFIRPIPPIAWIPLTILWFGIGNGPALYLTTVASFFPIVINTMTGAERVSQHHIDVARCVGASRRMILLEVIWPAALPYTLSGYRIGLGIGWMAVVAAEMIASHSGLGYLIHVSQDMLKTERVLAGMVVIGILGLGLDRLMVGLRDNLTKWS